LEGGVLASRYQLLSKLGEGNTGTVWRALDLELERRLAVRVIDSAHLDTPELTSRFLREVKAAARLSGPNVAAVFDCGSDEGTAYVAMELLEGESLAERLRGQGPLSPEATARLLAEISRGLGKAHSLGIVHANLKPSNIFLVWDDPTERAVILDFGVAKGLGMDLEGYGGPNTRVGQLMGTPSYLSSEQVSGRGGVDYRSDIWSLATIAFECLTGRRPFEDKTMGGLLLSICTEPPPVPSEVASVPAGFDEWFACGVDRDPERRFQSAAEASEELLRLCITTTSVPAVTVGPGLESNAPGAIDDYEAAREGQWPEAGGESEPEDRSASDYPEEAYEQDPQAPSVDIDVDDGEDYSVPRHGARPRAVPVVSEESDAIVARIPKRVVYIAGAAAIVLVLVGVLVASGSNGPDREPVADESSEQEGIAETPAAAASAPAQAAATQPGANPPAIPGATEATPTPAAEPPTQPTPAAVTPAAPVATPRRQAPVRQPHPRRRPRKKASSPSTSSRLQSDLGI
jgi:serine/threonine-protein kinase